MELQRELALSSASDSGERPVNAVVPALERHFTVAELSKRWFFSENTIRRLFSGEPDFASRTAYKSGNCAWAKNWVGCIRFPLLMLMVAAAT